MTQQTRTETDSFGPIEVPADCYWGAQTQRSLGNFPFGERERMPIRLVHAQAIVKHTKGLTKADRVTLLLPTGELLASTERS